MKDIYRRAINVYNDEEKPYKESFSLFNEGSAKGDPRCNHMVGVMTFYGCGVKKDTEKGKSIILNNLDELEKAWSNHLEGSGELLVDAYYNFNFIKNLERRFEILEKIYATKNDLNEKQLLKYADCYQFGYGVFENKTRAQQLYKECLEKYDSVEALNKYAFNILRGYDSVRANRKKAIELFEKGYSTHKGFFFEKLMKIYCGTGSETQENIDYKKAKEMASEYANNWDNVTGMVWLAVVNYLEGKTKQADEILNSINIKSEHDLYTVYFIWNDTIMYTKNNSNTRNIEKGNIGLCKCILNSKFLRMCVDVPYFWLSEFYRHQLRTIKDDELKTDFTKKYLSTLKDGSQAGDLFVLSELYSLYKDGRYVPVDKIKAFECIKKALEVLEQSNELRGRPYFLNILGECYEYGCGTARDVFKALECYKQSYLLKDGSNVGSIMGCFNYLYLSDKYRKLPKEEYDEALRYYLNEYAADLRNNQIWSNGRKDKEKDYFLAKLVFKEDKDPNYLATCYINGIGTKKDVNRAIELLYADESNNRNVSYFKIACLYLEEDKLDLAEQYFIKSNSDKSLSYLRDSDIHLYEIYSDRKSDKYDLEKALQCLLEATKEDKDNDIKLDEAFYLLGQFYQSREYGKRDLELAKKYYEKAKEHGLNCGYAIESVNRDILINKFYEEGIIEAKKQKIFNEQELKAFAKKYARDKYAISTGKGLYNSVMKMLHTGISGVERTKYIENELQDDFKSAWSDLRENSKKSLHTTTYLYSTLVELGYDGYKDMDFSAIVNGFSKAFEIELKLFFSTGLLKFLKANKINHEEFVNEAAKQQLPFIEKEIKVEDGFPVAYYSYSTNEEEKNFSLGQLWYIVTIGYENQFLNTTLDKNRIKNGVKTRNAVMSGATVNEHIIDYFDEVFDDEAFSSSNRRAEIANYLVDLANDVKIIQERRNPSTHEKVMTIDEAELCADYLVKSRNLIYDFLTKIRKKYRQGYFIKN